MSQDSLICAAHSVGGFLNHRGLSLAERCGAAAEGGFGCIGWALEDYERERARGRSDADIRAILADFDVKVAEVEFTTVGMAPGTHGEDWPRIRRDLLRLAGLVEARHLVCAACLPGEALADARAIARDYRSLCEDAAALGVLALLEAMPWSRIRSLGEAAEVVAMADHPAGGLVLDTWHFHRIGSQPIDVKSVPASFVRLIQISDAGPLDGDLFEDTVKRRLFPGEGGFPLVETLRMAAEHGVRAPVSVEVIGEAADRLTTAEMARRSFATTAAVLKEAGFEAMRC